MSYYYTVLLSILATASLGAMELQEAAKPEQPKPLTWEEICKQPRIENWADDEDKEDRRDRASSLASPAQPVVEQQTASSASPPPRIVGPLPKRAVTPPEEIVKELERLKREDAKKDAEQAPGGRKLSNAAKRRIRAKKQRDGQDCHQAPASLAAAGQIIRTGH